MSTSQSAPQSLTEWAQSRLTAHYETSESPETDFKTAFDSIFSSSAEIFLNHSRVSTDEYREAMAENLLVAKATVEWRDVLESPKEEGEKAHEAGIVAGFVVVTRSLKIRIRATPAQNHTFITLSAKIEQDPTATPDEHGDRRRIVHLFHTSVNKAAPVHIQGLKH